MHITFAASGTYFSPIGGIAKATCRAVFERAAQRAADSRIWRADRPHCFHVE